jgi:ATP-binding cassette, subfamily C, bacterial
MKEIFKKIISFLKFKRVYTPTFLQMEATECGAASLCIISAYYNKYVPLEEMRRICGVSRDGANALDVVRAAEKLGFSVQGIKCDIDDLRKMKLPVIIFWSFNHFLVVEKVRKNFVYLNDPASGHRKVSIEEFSDYFTGIAIAIQPEKKFEKKIAIPSFYSIVKKYLSKSFLPFLFLFLASFCVMLPFLSLTIFTQVFYDKYATFYSTSAFFFICLIIAYLFSFLTLSLQGYLLMRFNAKLSLEITAKFFTNLLRLPISFFSQRFPGELANRVLTTDRVVENLTLHLILALVNFIFVIIYAIVMIQIDLSIAIVAIIGASLGLLLFLFLNRQRTDAYACQEQDMGKCIGISVGALRNIETIKSFGMESSFFQRWAGYFTKVVDANQKIAVRDVLLTSAPQFLQMLILSSFLFIGAKEVISGKLTIGGFMAMQTLILNFLNPTITFINLGRTYQETKGDLYRLNDVMQAENDTIFKQEVFNDKQQEIKMKGKVQVKDLTFGYNINSEPLIKNLNFILEPGKSLALVGPVGSGKSTITKLVTGLYEPWSGTILLDDEEKSSVSRQKMVISIASVDQNFFIFEGSFLDNITLWDETILEEDVYQAAKDACIHEEILSRSQGYDSNISEGGRNLSGGQRQRLEIARALVRNPSILILDEATSQLDSETEVKIIDNIRKRGCSVIMIAHRLSTIKECDEIMVLEKGVVVQKGTNEELKKIKGIYLDLVEAQGL